MISVIMPTYNRATMMKQAVESAFMQSNVDVEIVIIDDCSTDDTKTIVKDMISKKMNIVYYRNETNCGPGYNRRLGYKFSNGEYIIFMDDDDYYIDKGFFQKALSVFQQQKDLACVIANSYIENMVDGTIMPTNLGFEGKKKGTEYLVNLNEKFKKPMSTFAAVFKRESLEKADLSNMKMVNDIAIYMRALLFGDVYAIKDIIGNYRVHSNNISLHIEKDFLIANMQERFWVAERLNLTIKKRNAWLNKQLIFCFFYYVKGTNPRIKDKLYLAGWIIIHSRPNIRLYKRIVSILIKERKQGLY